MLLLAIKHRICSIGQTVNQIVIPPSLRLSSHFSWARLVSPPPPTLGESPPPSQFTPDPPRPPPSSLYTTPCKLPPPSSESIPSLPWPSLPCPPLPIPVPPFARSPNVFLFLVDADFAAAAAAAESSFVVGSTLSLLSLWFNLT
ncbi:hypothetical protein MPTK1_4g07320 [Marchantia polymorpha subsp. ruderalis]|uniref:Uncharacterized protein n=2 Tax=Marchantia polymorpha TaxID=3197 RepID=A0AAF6B7D7_MARPO|nr:hypothetical protein MARPO_0115s0049 [Marchantia polymorpha]BBN07921.1 hypothetical protein Mp_4g07320 [Marchantia polymorpha subsp. ruderalis]|eukprot:PTQ31133.1 hypothetical protein MARPO_0115s0049 [Marchantia polymorpha]